MSMTTAEIVEKYVALRDRKAEMEKAHKAKKAQIDAALVKIENFLLKRMDAAGEESIRTTAGTAFKSTKVFTGVADWDSVLEFVRENDRFDMLTKAVSKDAVVAYREANDDIPPGVNWREEVTISVRRA